MNKEEMQEEIVRVVQELAVSIEKTEELQKINFGLFYQDGKISFLNLDAFKEKVNKKEENVNEKEN